MESNPSPAFQRPAETGSPTRSKACARGCGATTIETWVETKSFGGQARAFGYWVSDWTGDDCPACTKKIEDAKAAKKAAEEREVAIKRLIDQLGGPAPLTTFTLAIAVDTFTLEKQKAVEAAVNFDPMNESLFFYGPCGTGKSHLAIGIAIDQVNKGRSVEYFTPKSLNREFKRYQLDAELEKKFLRRLWMADVFILDELGVRAETAFGQEGLQEIMDGRAKNDREGMVFTTNIDLDEMSRAFGSVRIPDRIRGACRQIFVDGDSFRDRKKKNRRG